MFVDAPAIEAFLAVADSGSTHAAARSLGLSQASVSRRISRLEERLGVLLFLRTGHLLALSPAGALFLPQALQHFSGLQTAMKEIRATASDGQTTVTLAVLATLAVHALPNIMVEALRSRPDLRLRVLDLGPSEIERSVLDGTAEFALTMIGIGAPDLVHEVLIDQPLVLVVPEDHPLAEHSSITWAELKDLPMIGAGPASAHYRLLESIRPQINVRWQEVHQVQRITTALAMVAAGIGAALLPLNLALSQPLGVRTLAVTDPVITRRIGILRRSAAPLSPAADYLRRRIAAHVRHDPKLGHVDGLPRLQGQETNASKVFPE